MGTIGTGRGLLRNLTKKRGFEICRGVSVLLVAVTVSLTVLPVTFGEAYDFVFDNVRDQAVGVIIELILTEESKSTLKDYKTRITSLDERLKDIATRKHLYYAADHMELDQNISEDVTAYVRRFAGTPDISLVSPGYRIPPGGSLSGVHDGNFSIVYKDRVSLWQTSMKKIIEDNSYAAQDIKSSMDNLPGLKDATEGAYGNLALIQAGARIENLMNAELLKLQVDIERGLETEARFEMNEQQERIDDLAAFSVAVGALSMPETGSGY